MAEEVGCPPSSIQDMVSCLRQKPASILNDAQTKVGTCMHIGEGHSLIFYKWKTRPRRDT